MMLASAGEGRGLHWKAPDDCNCLLPEQWRKVIAAAADEEEGGWEGRTVEADEKGRRRRRRRKRKVCLRGICGKTLERGGSPGLGAPPRGGSPGRLIGDPKKQAPKVEVTR